MAGRKSCGLRIPEDVAVAGFMDDPLAVVADPGLTVHHPMVHMGQRAFEIFLSLLNEPQQTAPREILNTQLIIRRSTDVHTANIRKRRLLRSIISNSETSIL